MIGLIEDNCVENTIVVSRNFQEAFRIQEGESKYAILAGCMEISQQQIDDFAKFCGTLTGYAMINKRREAAYNDPRNGKWINFINKNLYQNPVKTQVRHTEEEIIGTVTAVVTEGLIKLAAKGIYDYSAKKANYLTVEQVFSFLHNYAMTDEELSNSQRVKLELAKIRRGLPLNEAERKKMLEAIKSKRVIELADMQTMTVLNNNSQLCESLTYQLFNLYCQKYGDDNGNLAKELEQRNFNCVGMDTLLRYYDYLGFTGNHARELVRVNANRYDKISRDQAYYLELGRLLVRDLSFDIPGVDIKRIQERCRNMTKYDPYQLRRGLIQKLGGSVIKTASGILQKRPDVVLNAGSVALSQFELEDGNILELIQNKFKKDGLELEDFNYMLDQSKKIKDKSQSTKENK